MSDDGRAEDFRALERLNMVNSRLWRISSLTEGLDEMLEAAVEVLHAGSGVVRLFDEEAGVLTVTAARGDFGKDPGPPVVRICDVDCPCARAFLSGNRLVIEDAGTAADGGVLHDADLGWRAAIFGPLADHEGRAIGVMSIHSSTPRTWRTDEVRRFELFSRQASDFIDRCRRTDALHDREKRLQAILHSAADAIVTIDSGGVMRRVNPAAERMFGYAAPEMIGRNVSLLMPAGYRERHDGFLARCREAGGLRAGGPGHELTGRRKDGTTFPIDLTLSQVKELGIFTGIIRDISPRKALEKRAFHAAEEERQRIARDLHDDLGSLLAGIKLEIEAIVASLDREGSVHSSKVRAAAGHLAAAIAETRRVSHGLSPVAPGAESFRRALRELAGSIAAADGWKCELICPEEVEIGDPMLATHLFRIAQEAVTNATKHSGGRHLRITVETVEGGLEMAIEDDGCGCQPPSTDWCGLGWRSMRDRSDAIGGRLCIESRDEGGTRVICRVPKLAW